MKKTLIIACITCTGLLFGLTGCETQQAKSDASTATAAAGSQQAYEEALAGAKAAIEKAGTAGGEWRDTGKILDKAEEAAAAGDYATATKHANSAMFQAKMGYEQAQQQATTGNPSYLY